MSVAAYPLTHLGFYTVSHLEILIRLNAARYKLPAGVNF